MDANGQFVGLAFDGNGELAKQRLARQSAGQSSIQTDGRYMHRVMHHLGHAVHVLKEMGASTT